MFRRKSNRAAAWMKLAHMLLPSPIQATVRPRIGPRCSSKVCRSAITWHGWLLSVRPLITGTVAAWAKRSTSSWRLARIITASTMRDSTLAVSSTVSPRPSCMSEPEAMVTAPPSWRMAASKEKRVRVEFFSKIIARVLPRAGTSLSGSAWPQPRRAALRRLASSSMARRVSASCRQRSMKCLGCELISSLGSGTEEWGRPPGQAPAAGGSSRPPPFVAPPRRPAPISRWPRAPRPG